MNRESVPLYYMHDNLLYHLGKLCIPRDERVNVIREAHTSLISGHFGVGKIVAQLQRYFYWPQMNETVSKYIKGCVMCATSKPSNINLGIIYTTSGTFTIHGKVSPWTL
jgi:hypothetical protein